MPISLDGGTDPVWARSGKELFYRTGQHIWRRARAGRSGPGGAPGTLFVSAGRFRTGSPSFDMLPGDQEFIMLRGGDLGNIFPLMVMTNWHKSRKGPLPGR